MIDTTYYLAIFFIFLRLLTFFTVIPNFFPSGTPATFKISLNLILSIILIGTIDISAIQNIQSNYAIIIYAFNEVMTGITLGFITSIIFYVIEMAGSLMDQQIGLGMISMFDPNTKSNASLLARLLHWVAILIFFIVDGHHLLIKELSSSYKVVGIGKSIIFQESIMTILNSFTQYFIIGLKIAIPIVLIMIITDLTMGLISRTVPQLNIMILGMPIKMLVGIASFLVALPMIIKAMVAAFSYLPDVYQSIYKALPLMFIFTSEDKTEEATPKKKSEARKKGQIPRSKDVNLAMTLVACTLVIAALGGYIGTDLKYNLIYFLSNNLHQEINLEYVRGLSFMVTYRIMKDLIPVVVPIMVIGIISSIAQSGFLFTSEPLKPSLGKLNPLKGLQNMFSKKNFVELGKNFIVVCILSYIGYDFVKSNYMEIINLGNFYLPSLGVEFKRLLLNIFMKITLVLIVLAAADYFVQRRMYNKEMRMSKQEVKEEFKQMEGDPQIKSKIKQKQREMATRRMMQAVPDATVVITNPTHLAIALKYQEGNMEAPKVVAKGADNMALRIKEIAKENDIPILENKPLARLMYEQVDVDRDIPADMYQAVAEILAIVFKMKKK
ncbi:fused FliR family export protein/FlhB family type III secretion system protein [Clostridium sp. YIM B02505]|uniref:Flagellar biosynthetic protein FliR n=1 Tax=Clostridium yunnanense TaxID=2800325 RepID=A0ABS1EU95_9CLOT|nr:fused FliR family export protein/FlhB family type III secretion system protein [Clostridium yunnanense]MBK1812909.1 fused FliR family export protein/FlhB family type III secretion system protein [Clostridium yunnanense]